MKFFCSLFLLVNCFAGYVCDPCNPCKPDNPCDACCCGPCEEYTPPPPPKDCAYNAPYIIETDCCSDFYAYVSFLYWQACEDNLEPAGLHVLINGINGNNPGQQQNQLLTMDFSFKPAFKVGLGLTFDCDDWEFFAEYTWFHQTPADDTTVLDPGIPNVTATSIQAPATFLNPHFSMTLYEFYHPLTSTASADFVSPSETVLKTKWELDLDIFDAQIARSYYVGQCLTFKTHFGLRGLLTDQTVKQSFNGATQKTDTFAPSLITDDKFEVDSWAVGPRAGIEAAWLFCKNISLFTKASASLLYTDHEVKAFGQSFNAFNAPLPSPRRPENATPTNVKFPSLHICAIRPDIEMNIGLCYEGYFNCGRFHYCIKAGYDALAFLSQNVFAKLSIPTNDIVDINGAEVVEPIWFPETNTGDLFIHGLNITARLDF